jgi:hypothetical protein
MKLTDTQRLDWLQEQIVDTIYLDDGTLIDVRGLSVREAIDRATRKKIAPCDDAEFGMRP